MSCYYDHRFVTDSMAVVMVDCTLGSEGRGMGIYVTESHAVMFADQWDENPKEVVLTEDELTRLDEEVAESDEANERWMDRDYDYGY